MSYPKPLSPVQQQIIDLLRQHSGLYLSVQFYPASCIAWSDAAVERAWRQDHGGKPVLGNVAQALVRRGLLTEETNTQKRRRVYRLAI